MTWDGDDYQRQFDALAATGVDVHGEAEFVSRFAPATVLDAGCGTGRVALELERCGCTVVGVDADASMLATAHARGSEVEWLLADLTDFDLGRSFDVVVLAGNVPLFTPPGTQAALVAGCARHVAASGALVAGFELGRGYSLADYDAHCRAAGLELTDRYATWGGDAFSEPAGYAVSVHRPYVAEPRG